MAISEGVVNFNKILEPVLWTLCGASILALILTDPIAVAWLLENILVICLWGLSVAVTATICFLCGYHVAKRKYYTEGYTNGWNHAEGKY